MAPVSEYRAVLPAWFKTPMPIGGLRTRDTLYMLCSMPNKVPFISLGTSCVLSVVRLVPKLKLNMPQNMLALMKTYVCACGDKPSNKPKNFDRNTAWKK
mmetsp:Transcript_58332/g.161390  ORF Transcript_58332/g.161390 Transcript_58332/m.161390 type:complete len:99 (+) Transcript_58332:191-487(+)